LRVFSCSPWSKHVCDTGRQSSWCPPHFHRFDHPAGIIVATFPQRSPPWPWPKRPAGAWDQRPDRRTRRAYLHLL